MKQKPAGKLMAGFFFTGQHRRSDHFLLADQISRVVKNLSIGASSYF